MRLLGRILKSTSALWPYYLGIVLASTLVIIPTDYAGPGELALSVLCCIGGFLLAFLLARLDQKSKSE